MALQRWVMVFAVGMAWLSAHAGTKVINVELGVSTAQQLPLPAASRTRAPTLGPKAPSSRSITQTSASKASNRSSTSSIPPASCLPFS